jgi:hypothetical protein
MPDSSREILINEEKYIRNETYTNKFFIVAIR